MANNKEIIDTLEDGTIIERTNYKNGSYSIMYKNTEGRSVLHNYRVYAHTGKMDVPYMSWKNLYYCANHGDYLLTATQNGTKLVSGLNFRSKQDVDDYWEKYKSDECCFDITTYSKRKLWDGKMHENINTVVCRKGCLNDYYKLDDVIRFYAQQKVYLTDEMIRQLEDMFRVELVYLFTNKYIISEINRGPYPYYYANPCSVEEMIVTGLGLGYPIESTAYLLRN